MEEKSIKITHIKNAAEEILSYMDGRRNGQLQPILTPWKKLNKATSNGLEWNTIFTIVGMSGSGKSAIASQLETGILELNKEPIEILNFNYEMLASRVVGRKISHELKKTVQELYSGNGTLLSDTDYERAKDIAQNKISNLPIYYVETRLTVSDMKELIIRFYDSRCKKENKGMIVILDHTLLTKGRQGEEERILLQNLYNMFMEVKKMIKCTIFVLSQMNREIERVERLTRPETQYPMKRDIFGSDAVFQASDYIMFTHKPATLNLREYGPLKLPVEDSKTGQYMIYWHIVKNRDGEPQICSMLDNLKHNRVVDYPN